MKLTKKQEYFQNVLKQTAQAAVDVAFQRILEGKLTDTPARQLVLALIELEVAFAKRKEA